MSILQAPKESVRPSQFRSGVKPSGSGLVETHAEVGQIANRLSEAEPNASLNSSATTVSHNFFRRLVFQRLAQLDSGRLTVRDASTVQHFGPQQNELSGTLYVRDPRFYRFVVLGGGIGAAEAFIRGFWDADDLTRVMQVLARKTANLSRLEQGTSQLLRPFRAASHWLRRNTVSGSKRNISAHYDLSNEFFALMLDPTMTYSSGVFPTETSTLEEASTEKYDRICRKLALTPDDHVLEIGTGWGGFAEHAARAYGCRVTTTTISDQQHAYAARRFAAGDWGSRIQLLKKDYRQLTGEFDKLVSIEMIEAVGEKYLHGYFRKCCELLRPHGLMALQAITIPDHRYDRYRRSMDFIQKYIFPGGFLPSMGAMADAVGKQTDFRFLHVEDFGPDYAKTLAAWRTKFWEQLDDVREMGFDERFIRTWNYYLSYCEAGFLERQVGVSQLTFGRSGARQAPIKTTTLEKKRTF